MTENSQGDTGITVDNPGNRSLRLTRTMALELAALAVIVVIAALIRLLPLQYGAYFTAYDPLFQLRATEYVVENGYGAWWSWHDTMSWYPMGRNVANSAYPGVPFSAAFVYSIVSAVGMNVTVYDVCLFFPILMACITVITTYYLGKELKGSVAGIFAAMFLAINPTFIGRTAMGFFDTESIGIFCMVATGLFFLRSTDKKRSLEHRAVYGVISGLTLGYIFASWGAAKYVPGLLALYMLILMYTERFEVRHLISYSLTIGVGNLIVIFVPRLGIYSLMSLDSLVAFGLIPAMVIYESIKDRIDVRLLANLAGALVVVGIIGVFLLPAVGINIPIGFKFLKVLNPFTSTSDFLYNSVAENKVIAWSSFFQEFGAIMTLGIAGTYFAVKEQDEKNIYASLFFLTALYFAGVMSRLSQILAAPVCIMAGYGLVEIIGPFFTSGTAEETRRSRRRRRAVFGVNKTLSIVFIVLIIIGIVPSILSSVASADRPTSLANSGIPWMFNGEYPQDWPETFEWMKQNVTDDEVICSWWDYGYWIEAMAGKTTMADGATQTTRQISNIGNIMMRPQNESIKILERYGADYIVVFHTFNPNTFQDWGFGDEGKWPWMVQIGGMNLTDYQRYGEYSVEQTDVFRASTLYNLMYLQPDPQYFSLAFSSSNRYVLVYKIHYPE
ncbi:MAG: glycosyltransferase family 39 protein [Candidatus Bathyarchaeota archaeon]|nr:glycosyltransferase family 39 protein [Candidatus Bathyarchaeota archaeon]